ncbi:MAG: hypothetical protein FWC93_07720 [Defluviitaleaceae bacterium]|nr:hypothetical protein [Defluviitaleaceae bacterium]
MHKLPIRKAARLEVYDYSSAGAYFITICTQDKAMLFGNIVGADSISARMVLNDAGKMIDAVYRETINQFHNATSTTHIVMPNHFHAIIIIDRADIETAPTLSDVTQSFKRNTTIKYIQAVKAGLHPPFNKRIWQRGYHDQIIRNEADYLRIWQYIDENPMRWAEDCYYAPQNYKR